MFGLFRIKTEIGANKIALPLFKLLPGMTSFHLLYEDLTLLVCVKPAGLMVEPDRNNHPNLLQEVKKYLKEKTGEKDPYVQHLHRLDRPVSGIVLFTKQKEHLRDLSEQFAKRNVKKYYQALTDKAPVERQGTLEQWHRKEKKKAVIVAEGTPYSELMKLDYSVQPLDDHFLWEIELHTGKYHQIRVQLAGLGCPIIGDALYCSAAAYKPNAIALHAAKLILHHPVLDKEMVFEAKAGF